MVSFIPCHVFVVADIMPAYYTGVLSTSVSKQEICLLLLCLCDNSMFAAPRLNNSVKGAENKHWDYPFFQRLQVRLDAEQPRTLRGNFREPLAIIRCVLKAHVSLLLLSQWHNDKCNSSTAEDGAADSVTDICTTRGAVLCWPWERMTHLRTGIIL